MRSSERGLDANGNIQAFLVGGATRGTFSLKRSDDFDVSDCAVPPGGKLLVLERRFSWTSGIAMRIRSVPLAAIKPNATVDGAEVVMADMGYQIDNMEGLSRAPRARRRAGADVDFRRQFLAAATNAAAAVHVGRRAIVLSESFRRP